VKLKITYVHVIWHAPAQGQPIGYYDEIDSDRWSIRCIREFSDGSFNTFSKATYNWRDVMPEAPIPHLAEINEDPQFQARNIPRRAFESLWVQHYGLNQSSMMEILLEVLPGFKPHWDAFVDEWQDNPHNKQVSGLPNYLVLATLAGFLVEQRERNESAEFKDVFSIVEHWLTRGDKYVRDAAGAGLLEDLQNPARYKKLTPEDFKPWFGPETLRCWERLKKP
jgi:hypothetical protein